MASIGLAGIRRLAFTVVLGQAAITLIAAAAAGALAGPGAGVSALLGGGVSTAGSLAMALLGFRSPDGASAGALLGALLLGEAAKFCVIIVLFALVLTLIRTSAAAMFVTYAATFLVYFIVLASWLPMFTRGMR
jgi:F0F1-type ATP synthase assembly protein I